MNDDDHPSNRLAYWKTAVGITMVKSKGTVWTAKDDDGPFIDPDTPIVIDDPKEPR